MTFPNNNPSRNPANLSRGMGGAGWIAIIIVVAIIAAGALYWETVSGTTSTANNGGGRMSTTGLAPSTSVPNPTPAPSRAPK